MTLASLSVVVSSEATDAPALEAVAAMALREEAHLHVVCLGVEPISMTAMEVAALYALWNETRGLASVIYVVEPQGTLRLGPEQLRLGLLAKMDPKFTLWKDVAGRRLAPSPARLPRW